MPGLTTWFSKPFGTLIEFWAPGMNYFPHSDFDWTAPLTAGKPGGEKGKLIFQPNRVT
jgi:hypothetical protein